MSLTVDEAMKRLENALGLLEASVSRRLEAERRRGDLETELQIMLTRLHRAEAAADDVGNRVKVAIDAIEDVLGRAEPVDSD
jgi:hypothetical protein